MAVLVRQTELEKATEPLRAGEPLSADAYTLLRRRAIFECCKWDPQVGDTSALCRFPLLLRRKEWSRLAAWAEQLAAESMQAEAEILRRPALMSQLGLPRAVVRSLASLANLGRPRDIARVIRFDFHWCTGGWRISEANSDVPGGFIEASGFAHLMAEHYPSAQLPRDPAAAYADCVAAAAAGGCVALVHATAYTDDRQVMMYLARHLAARGIEPCLVSPADLVWSNQRASQVHSRDNPLAAVVRFYPGEWLPNLPRRCGWEHFFAGSHTPLSNPATALVTQSKRFPLVWDQLAEPLDAWRQLLPETRSLADVPWRRDESWVLKPALGRVGEGIGLRGVSGDKDWRQIASDAAWHPAEYAAQRRFEAIPVITCEGPRYPVLGVFTIDGRAAGIYGRLAARPLIDGKAQDVAVLLEEANNDE